MGLALVHPLDALTKRHTSWTVAELVKITLAARGEYVPTLLTKPRSKHPAHVRESDERTQVADAIDEALAAAGSSKRVWRGTPSTRRNQQESA